MDFSSRFYVSWEMPLPQRYTYLGDRSTCPTLAGQPCHAVLREDGKCIRGRNGAMLVEMEDGRKMVVLGRRLRKLLL